MAEFLNQDRPESMSDDPASGFGAMGKPVPFYRREAGYQTCRDLGLESEGAFSAVNGMAEALKRDQPYEAMAAGMRYLDLTGTYRLMAVLLTAGPTVEHVTA